MRHQLGVRIGLQRGVERATVFAPIGTEDDEHRDVVCLGSGQGLLHSGLRIGGLVVRQRRSACQRRGQRGQEKQASDHVKLSRFE